MTFGAIDRRRMASTYIDHRRAFVDLVVITVVLVAVWLVVRRLDLFELLYSYTRAHEDQQVDEIVIVVLLSTIGLIAFGARRMTDQRREIVARQRAEDRAHRLALADALTGLPNRREFETRLRAGLERMPREGSKFAMMMIDLDRFKPINDVFGHAVGDQALVAFSKRAGTLIGTSGVLARFGGDEFAVLLGPIADPDEPARTARRILKLFEAPFAVGGADVSLGASIGIALAPQDGVVADELMRRADIALYRAKNSGRGTFRFFEPEMDTQVQRRARIERDLRLAIEAGSVMPFYEPFVDLVTGEITGFEALARWTHPELGEVQPEQFIAIAEDSGLITQLSMHLLRIAARDATAWPRSIRLAFNISRTQLSDPMLVLRVLQVLGETGLSPKRLEIEISEDALVGEIIAAKEALAAFHAAGVRIALDDFGTGNSSLHHLRECRFDRLKIDRSLVGTMLDSGEDATFVNAVLGLSRELHLEVTAEGIEKDGLVESLRAHGCAEGQGFRFSKAVPANEALLLIGRARVEVAV